MAVALMSDIDVVDDQKRSPAYW